MICHNRFLGHIFRHGNFIEWKMMGKATLGKKVMKLLHDIKCKKLPFYKNV